MTKDAFVTKLAGHTGLSKAAAGKALKTTLDTLGEVFKKGDKITFVGFGTFSVNKRAKRMGRNPRTGQKITIPASKIVKFKPGKSLKELVNK
jgi:DNA-binding protein HU-beta